MGVANIVLMMENAIYSVISPESCAAIIWRDAGKAELAANALRLTARDMLELGLIDGIVPEPNGGAQNNWDESAVSLGKSLKASLDRLAGLTPKELVDHRYEKFRKIGSFFEG
jgi:acetyl-CoA carboxylase carboxyl transferase subunit alpha